PPISSAEGLRSQLTRAKAISAVTSAPAPTHFIFVRSISSFLSLLSIFCSSFRNVLRLCVEISSYFRNLSLRLSLLIGLLRLRLLLLSLRSDLQFLYRFFLLLVSQLNLGGEHDAHRAGRGFQEIFQRAAKPALNISKSIGQIRA